MYIDTYVFEIDEKKSILISQLIAALVDMNIRSHKNWMVLDMLHYLIYMPEKSNKQTLCVMSKNLTKKPSKESWEEIKNGKFYLINGQHNVTASNMMVKMNLDNLILKHLREWNCYVV